MRRRDLLSTAGAVLVSGAIGGHRAAAQGKKVLKASDVHPEGYPTVQAVENMSTKLDQATNGRLSIQMYASMQLGGEKEVIEQAQVGAIQFARVSVGTLGPVVDDLNVLDLPFVFRDVAHMLKVVDGALGRQLLGRVTASSNARRVRRCWVNAAARILD